MEQLKKQRFVLWSNEIASSAIKAIKYRDTNGDWEVTISPVEKDKTIKQLGALFGLWIKEESQRMGESEQYVHAKWKAGFLARIYFIEPKGAIQEMWVDHFVVMKEVNNTEKFEQHSRRISLSWANLEQTKQYMAAIEEHYQAEGLPLTVPDRHYKMWKK